MNLYGFAGGDPVTYSDPFGLCPIEVDGIPCAVTYAAAGAGIGAGAAAFSTGVCAVGTVGVCGLAAPGTIAGGAAAGGLIGGVKPSRKPFQGECEGTSHHRSRRREGA